ncbi:hypothetical protein H072_3248 [Dactylellina haptotyla CBS 200.50]|uniref:Putative transcription factor kapC n=1 Tax=Dactylellina haptotyla (strain CBS 200.50) TaxID=1284197 RepID=S8BTE4_DACHA|nr:hypothetical protein H072_3248 [Dactylellina haptotyla CBS 200.50]
MTEVVSMANGHRTLPAPTITSTQVPHNFLKLLLLPVEEAPRVSSATNIPSFARLQDQQSSPSSSSHYHNHHNHNHNHYHAQQQHTPSSSAEQPSKRASTAMNIESEPPASAQPVRDWSIDPHLNSKDANNELLLRKQLLSAISGEEPMQQPTPMSSQQAPRSPTVIQRADIRPSSSLSPGSGGEDSLSKADSRHKRELNTSKRAAQNRNAQRAFRARKEEYIKSLESKVRDYEAVEERNGALESENAALRQYIMHLQRRLLDHLGEGEALPDPPAGLNIENLHISSRPSSAKMSLKPELPPISSIHDKALSEPVAGVKRARVDE